MGDREALGQLYDIHAGTLIAIAQRFVSSRELAEDLAHDVFLEVWKRAESYDSKRASVRSWLILRLRSRCLDHLRSAAVSRRDASEDVNLEREIDTNFTDAFRVGDWLQTLQAPHREVVTLAYYGGLSASEIAGQLSIPIGTVKSRTAAAIKALRAQTRVAV